jgi:hypothetical protein
MFRRKAHIHIPASLSLSLSPGKNPSQVFAVLIYSSCGLWRGLCAKLLPICDTAWLLEIRCFEVESSLLECSFPRFAFIKFVGGIFEFALFSEGKFLQSKHRFPRNRCYGETN